MTLERAYILLAVFYSILVAIGIIALLVGGGPLWGVISVGLGALVATGLWGHTMGKPVMNPRMWRPLAGILAVAFLVQLFAVFALHPPGAELAWLLTGAIFSVLPAIMLFQYGKRDQDVWATPEEREGGKVLDELLAEGKNLFVEKHETDREASVTLTKAGDEYRASVVRRYGDQQERFEERFACPSTLAFFIEKFTCISVSDIAAQYTDDRVPAT